MSVKRENEEQKQYLIEWMLKLNILCSLNSRGKWIERRDGEF